ncbi:hypothetical protein DXG01_004642 [Tephrocybe rancida]|nr:hypothetical protein DXG01_004642 [Tephrocybe rancida]
MYIYPVATDRNRKKTGQDRSQPDQLLHLGIHSDRLQSQLLKKRVKDPTQHDLKTLNKEVPAMPKKPAKKPTSAEVVLTSSPITPLILAMPKKPTIMSSVEFVHAAVPTPLGKLTDPSFTSFDESTLLLSFSMPADKGKDPKNSDPFMSNSFTSFGLNKKQVTSFRHQCAISVSLDEGSTDWECEFSINTSDLVDALPTPSVLTWKVNLFSLLNALKPILAPPTMYHQKKGGMLFMPGEPQVFSRASSDTIVGNAVSITGGSYKHCKSELEGHALLEKAVQVGNKVARITYIYEKTYLTVANFM